MLACFSCAKFELLIPLYGFNSDLGTTFTTALVLAKLDEDGVTFTDEYSTHEYDGLTEKNGAFIMGDSEVSLTAINNVTYAFCRGSGKLLASYDMCATWSIITESGNDDGKSVVQPSLAYIDETNQLILTWAQPSKDRRDIMICLYNPIKEPLFRKRNKIEIYNNFKGGDMGDPSCLYLGNGCILITYYDTQRGVVSALRTKLIKRHISE